MPGGGDGGGLEWGCRGSLPPLISVRKINNAGNHQRKVAAVKQQWLLIPIDRRAASFPRRPQQKHSSAAATATTARPPGEDLNRNDTVQAFHNMKSFV